MAIPTNSNSGSQEIPRKPNSGLPSIPTGPNKQTGLPLPNNLPVRPPTQNRPIEPVVNPFDEEDDETFTPIPSKENEDKERLRERERELKEQERLFAEQQERERQKRELEEQKIKEKEQLMALSRESEEEEYQPVQVINETVDEPETRRKVNKSSKRKKDKTGRDLFIDEKNLKLEPLGRKVKVNDFDKRKNIRQRSKVVQMIALSVLLLLLGLGLKNALIPPATLTTDEVTTIVAQSVNMTNFPSERGKGFAEDFIQAYLTLNDNEINSNVLAYYLSGDPNGTFDMMNKRVASSGFSQNIVYGPTVYETTHLTDYSENYVVAALVEKEGIETRPGQITEDDPGEKDEVQTQWLYFSVNLYYDEENNTLSVTKDSPTLIPNFRLANSNNVPAEAPLGTGRTSPELNQEVKSVVMGYMRGYAVSTVNNHADLDQYVAPDPPLDLLAGMGGQLDFADTPETSITYTAYTGLVEGEVKVDVIVDWRDTASNNQSITYKSNYVMTLELQSNNLYLVTKFAPKLYFKESN